MACFLERFLGLKKLVEPDGYRVGLSVGLGVVPGGVRIGMTLVAPFGKGFRNGGHLAPLVMLNQELGLEAIEGARSWEDVVAVEVMKMAGALEGVYRKGVE